MENDIKTLEPKMKKIKLKKRDIPRITNLELLSFNKPLIKWVGGKTQILKEVLSIFPKKMNNYHEPFIGGGSVLLGLLTCKQNGLVDIHGKIYAYDLNKELIAMYKNIQSNALELYEEINKLIQDINIIEKEKQDNGRKKDIPENIEEALKTKESYYYWIRNCYNKLKEKTSIKASAMFIFLNKTCFRGLYRIGPKGFNVPYGNYKNPEIINKKHLLDIQLLIKDVIFTNMDYKESMDNIEINDFVYLDPPYAPEKIDSFVAYTSEGFGLSHHLDLFERCNYLFSKFLMSNSNVDLVKDNFKDKKFNIQFIDARRAINSKKPSSLTKEVLISNY